MNLYETWMVTEGVDMCKVLQSGDVLEFNGEDFSDDYCFVKGDFYEVLNVSPAHVKLKTKHTEFETSVDIYPDGFSSFNQVEKMFKNGVVVVTKSINLATIMDDIKKKFQELQKYNPEIAELKVVSVKLVGSYGTAKYQEGKSDIDFQIVTDKELPSWADISSIVDYINSELIAKYGECEKGNLIDVVAINDRFLDGGVFEK